MPGAFRLDSERLQLMTKLLQSLQGLKLVLLGVVFLIHDMRRVFLRDWFADLPWTLLGIAWFISIIRISEYYRRRFGYVEPQDTTTTRQFVILMSTLLALLFFGKEIVPLAEYAFDWANNALHVAVWDDDHRLHLAPLLFWLFILPWGGRIKWDPYWRYFICAGIFIWSFVVFYPVNHPDIARNTIWTIADSGWRGLTLIALGMYEHLLLVYLLPRRKEEHADNQN